MIKQLCLNLKIPGNPLLFALRDTAEGEELVTDENLRKKIRDKAPLKYGSLIISFAFANPWFIGLCPHPSLKLRRLSKNSG